MNCPIDHRPLEQAGRTHRCSTCDGAWVRSEVLVPLLEERTSTLVELPWQPSAEGLMRACPECAASMQGVKLGTVALDRCEAHGVWFDAKELAALLKQAKQFRAHTEHHQSLLQRLHALFD